MGGDCGEDDGVVITLSKHNDTELIITITDYNMFYSELNDTLT